jgi:hypothetical protein
VAAGPEPEQVHRLSAFELGAHVFTRTLRECAFRTMEFVPGEQIVVERSVQPVDQLAEQRMRRAVAAVGHHVFLQIDRARICEAALTMKI